MIGIYGIKNKINNKIYIGQSTNISMRFVAHRCDLNHNRHFNEHLQRSWNKYGHDAFDFIVIEECDTPQLNTLENKHINDNKMNVYNFEHEVMVGGKLSEATKKKMSEAASGENNSFFGKTHTEKSKTQMSKWKKQNYLGTKNPNYGKKQSNETVLKMIHNNSGTKLNESKVKEIVGLLKLGTSHQEIANKFNISRTVITRISNGTRWANVTGGPIVPVIYNEGKRVFDQNHKDRIGAKRKGQKHSEETKQLMREKALSRRRCI